MFSFFMTLIHCRSDGKLEPIPADSVQVTSRLQGADRQTVTLRFTPVNNLVLAVDPICVSLGRKFTRRELANSAQTHTWTLHDVCEHATDLQAPLMNKGKD